MPHVLIAGKIHDAGLDVLAAASGFTFEVVPKVTVEAFAPLLPGADALVLRTQKLSAETIATAPQLKIVSRHGVGYDAVDVDALTARSIPLCIVGDVNSRAVAEHTLMLMLAAARRTVALDQASRQGNWNERNKFDAVELDGKTLLVMGFGRIGKRVAQLAQAFGMRVLVHDPYVEVPGLGCEKAASLESGLAIADFVTLHLPAAKTPVMDAGAFAAMKHGAVLVNAARGELVDEAALVKALDHGSLRHAALDVLVDEPPATDHPLLRHARVTISPHNAGLTEECAARMSLAAVRNVVAFFEGRLDTGLVVNGVKAGL
jgi:D-3-phosphoglycerate dehydrogenase / 2-oxoglutarate reductase